MSSFSKNQPRLSLFFSFQFFPFRLPLKVSPSPPPLHLFSSTGSFPFPSKSRPCCASFPFGHMFLPFSSTGLSKFRGVYAFDQFSGRNCRSSHYLAVSSAGFRTAAKREEVLQIVELVKGQGEELESKLDSLNARLSVASLAEVFVLLNGEKVSGLRFFRWFRRRQPELARNSDVCSLIVDHCGHLGHFVGMRCILDEFRLDMICLTKRAFGFLCSAPAGGHKLSESTKQVITILHEVGGSCYASGIHALIEFFCGLGSFDMAKFVVENTERKMSYYNVLIKEMCRMHDFKAARDMLNEIKKEGCGVGVQAFNHVISSLCKLDHVDAWKLLQEMKDTGCVPDALTFEILICYCCRHGKFEDAFQLLDDMEIGGLEPRLSTHAFIIKEFFRWQRHEEAYMYVVNVSSKFKHSGNMSYSLLASLHERKGNVVMAKSIISEMIEKGLKPEFNVYLRVLKRIQTSGRTELAAELQQQFLQLES